MATDNKGVMVYVTPELETALEQYCMERNITRKTRDGHVFASLGTGIVQYLKSQLLGTESKSVISPSTILTKDEVLGLIKEYFTNNVPSTVLTKDEVLESIEEYFTNKIPSLVPDETLRCEVEAIKESMGELEIYTKNQFEAIRGEIKKPLAIVR